LIDKERTAEAIRQLPEEATVEDAIEKICLLYRIERGIDQANSGQQVSQGEA
jgi:hypothetical protein